MGLSRSGIAGFRLRDMTEARSVAQRLRGLGRRLRV